MILAFEHKLRKEAMKKVHNGHTLADALEAVIRDPDLKEAYFTTPNGLEGIHAGTSALQVSAFQQQGKLWRQAVFQFLQRERQGIQRKNKEQVHGHETQRIEFGLEDTRWT